MKILYSHRTLSADGQSVHIDALTHALAARGHEVVIVGPRPGGRPLDARTGENALRGRMPRAMHEIAERLYSVYGENRLDRAADGADILYERYNLFFEAGARVAKRRSLPFLLEVNAPLVEERAAYGGLALSGPARRSETRLWRAADLVLPVTAVLAEKVAAAGVDPARIHVIHNGAEPAFLAPADPAPVRARHGLDGKIVLGFSGFVRAWHGVERVVDFIAASARQDLALFVVGDGEARASLEARARSLGVGARVVFAGVVQRAAMPAHVAAFDIALQPAAVPYASPLKLFEYMAQGRAILAPRQPNICEILSDDDAALFAPDDAPAFAAGLARLVSDGALRARLGAAARAKLLRRELTAAGNAARVERLAADLIESRS